MAKRYATVAIGDLQADVLPKSAETDKAKTSVLPQSATGDKAQASVLP